MHIAAINAFIRANSPYPLVSPSKGKDPVVALIGILDMERRQQHVAAISVSGSEFRGLIASDRRELLRHRIKEAVTYLDRNIASLRQ